MRYSNFNLGDTIIVKLISNKNLISQFCCVCWPSNQVNIFNLALSKSLLNLNGITECQTVLVQKLESEKNLKAVEIDIEYVKNLSSTSLFDFESTYPEDSDLILALLKETYLNKSIVAGQHLILTYMGQRLVFKAIYADGLPNKVMLDSKSLQNKIENSLKLTETNLPANIYETFAYDSKKEFEHLIEFNKNIYTISHKTKFNLINNFDLKEINFDAPMEKGRKISFNEIGGLGKEIEILKDYFINQLNFDGLYKQIGKFK